MNINIIESFEDREQEIRDVEVANIKNTTLESFIGLLYEFEKPPKDLRKLSLCASTDNPKDLPNWFIDCNGKIYFEEGATV